MYFMSLINIFHARIYPARAERYERGYGNPFAHLSLIHIYYYIKEKLNETKASRDKYISAFIEPIKKKVAEAGLTFDIKGRTKSIHSIWNQIQKQKTCLLYTSGRISEIPATFPIRYNKLWKGPNRLSPYFL